MALTARKGQMGTWYPDNAWSNAVGFDGYNWYGCVNPNGPWVTPTHVFNAAHKSTVSVGKPMVIVEWGTGEDPAVVGNRNCPRYADNFRSACKQLPARPVMRVPCGVVAFGRASASPVISPVDPIMVIWIPRTDLSA
jgi:hypothetical protein